MKIQFYLGREADASVGGFKRIPTLAKVSGYFDDQLGFLKLNIYIKQGHPSSALTAAVTSHAINAVFEADASLVVKSLVVECDEEVPEWA